ncbi:MAG: efflux RND transporter permease subunit, partial [Fimbriimonadales bacterium]|nr:efflux RND transporter permease subunit [Fimbriimonadales bacterium]
VRNLIAQIPGIKDPDLSWTAGKPELQVRVDREKATALGVSLAEIAAALRTAYEGDTSVKYREAGQEYAVRVRLRQDQRQRLSDLNDLVVAYVQGAPVYLRDVATITLGEGPTKIERTDRQRRVTVTANLMPGYTPGNMRQVIDARLREANVIPPGVRAQWFGENEVQAREGIYIFQALLLGIILVYLLMVALFENWLYPFIIMFTVPQALVGALLALIIFRSELNIISMIGVITLMGLVGKGAIILVDYTNTLRQRGLARDEALIEAGATRLRPILMTVISLVLAKIPVALAIGRGSEFRSPLGLVIIGGMLMSTILTLLVIPCMYTVMDDFTRFLGRVIWKRGAVPVEAAVAPSRAEEEETARL